MEAGTDGCSRPSWGLHLQSSLSAGGVGIRRGSRSCRGEIGRTTWSAPGRRSPGKKTVATNLETRSKFSGTKNLPIILTRSRRPSACVGTVEDQNSCSCCEISPFFTFTTRFRLRGTLPPKSDNLPCLFHELVRRQRDSPYGSEVRLRRCP